MKVAIVYDRINKFGGAERVLLSLHEIFPEAPLYTSVYDSKKARWAKVFPEIYTSPLNIIKSLRDKHEFLAPLMPFVFSRFNFDNYDLVISVTSEFAKNINVKNKHICYCLTPTRYLWSHYDKYFENKYLKLISKPIVSYLKKTDLNAAKKPDQMIAISTEVKRRIKKYYKRDAKIIFPPVQNFASVRQLSKKYYLIVSRLVKYKKVDLAIEAFNELNLPLVIVGTGREENNLKKMARKNIKFLGQVSDEKLAAIYKNARALIFPQEEDFGIVAVEAQMYGIPVIGYGKGGILDIVSKNTGVFFYKQNKKNLIKVIKEFDNKQSLLIFDRKILRKNAERFSEKRFKDEFLNLVREV